MYNTNITEKRDNFESTIKDEDFITLRNLTSKNSDILESKDRTVDDYLDRLLNESQPAIDDEDAFTNTIMDSLPDIAPMDTWQGKKEKRQFTLYHFIRLASSVAAVFLLGFFITVKMSTDNAVIAVSEDTQNVQTENNIPDITSCSTHREMYRCYKEYRESRTSYYSQLKKTMNYENL